MYVADHLSRAYLADQGEPSGEFQVFALELEEINLLAQLQKATEQDPIMQSLKKQYTYRMNGYARRSINPHPRLLELQGGADTVQGRVIQ